MGKLSSKTRNKLPAGDFGDPADRSYPMPDREHAIDAKARASQMWGEGKLSEDKYHAIVAKANALLHGD